MVTRFAPTTLMAGVASPLAIAAAEAQPLGTFTWQLQPFCNVVTVNLTQQGAVDTMDGLGDWVTLMPPTLAPPAAIGAFSPDDPRASLLVWSAKTLWRVNLAETPARHARQDMR